MRIVKWLIGLVVGVVALIVIALMIVPTKAIADRTLEQVQAQIGRQVSVGDDVRFSLFPNVAISLSDVQISNADWSTDAPFVEAKTLAIGLDLAKLIGGDIHVQNLTVKDANLFLHQDGTRANWDFGTGEEASAQSSSAPGISVTSVSITNTNITYLNGANDPLEISNISATLSGRDAAVLTANITPFEEPIALTVTFGDLQNLINGTATALDLNLETAGGALSFVGDLSTEPSVNGVLSLEADNPDRIMTALGQSALGLGGAAKFTTEIVMADAQNVALKNMSVSSPIFTGTATADLSLAGETPYLDAVIAARSLGSKGSSGSSSSNGWSKAPIDASALGLLNGKIAFTADQLFAGPLTFTGASVNVTIDQSRAVATLNRLTGYEGLITGQFVMNNRSGLSVAGALNASDVALKPLLTSAAGIERFSGTAQANVNFLSSGNSVHAIMNALSGDGAITVGAGTISGLNLDGLLQGQSNGGTTVFDSLTASWTIAGGQLSNNDLLMKLPKFETTGQGRVGLGPRDIDYTITPNFQQGAVLFPVRVQGPWAKPNIYPDLAAARIEEIDKTIDAVTGQAEKAVDDQIDQITNQLEQSVQDALGEQLGNELKNSLGGLFGN